MRDFSLLLKPASGTCNMQCKYCFYRDEMVHRACGDCGIMSAEIMEIIIQKALDETEQSCSFIFQGGEPTVAGLSFFEQFVSCADRCNKKSVEIHYSLQTNGYGLDGRWAEFFATNHFLIGLSLDGTEEVHNQCRKDCHGGKTFQKVMETIGIFRAYGVEFNILTVVTSYSVKQVNQIYNFFRRENFVYQQYIECLDTLEVSEGMKEYALTSVQYGDFLIALFKKWCRDLEVGKLVHIRYFENLLMMLSGEQPESCNMRGRCTKQWVVEADGSVYPCDFYALDKWKMGSFQTDSIQEMEAAQNGMQFVESSKQIPEECTLCQWFSICRNGCRRSCDYVGGQRQTNKYCESYKKFFTYAVPKLTELSRRGN